MVSPKRQRALRRGQQGEAFVARVLQNWGWTILEQRWRCRWGEIDLVAHQRSGPRPTRSPASRAVPQPPRSLAEETLVFVEVKVRSAGAWDDQGLAITSQKQHRLWRTAQQFLLMHESLAGLPCRFDVALVHCRLARVKEQTEGDRYSLQRYIKGAFEAG